MGESDKIILQLESIQKEIRDLNRTVSEMQRREEDPMVKRIGLLLSESNLTMVDQTLGNLKQSTGCVNQSACLHTLRGELEATVDLYSLGKMDDARERLEKLSSVLCATNGPCHDNECSRQAREMIQETARNVELFERLNGTDSPPGGTNVEAQEIASALDPLSYPARVRILSLLAQKDCNFTELSHALELRTGHLQHHLRPLREAGYVRRLSGRGRYSITPKGTKVLKGAAQLVSELR